MSASHLKIYLWKSRNKQWRIQFRSRNGKVLMVGTGYNRKANAIKTVRSILAAIKADAYQF